MPRPSRSFDERCRLLLFAAFLLIVTGTPASASLTFLGLGLSLLVVMGLAGVRPRMLFQHLLLAAPFLLLLVFGLPGPVMKPMLIRFALALGATSTLVCSTTFPRLTQGMSDLGVPRLFLMLLGFTWRYLHLLGDEAQKLRQAAISRGWQGRTWTEARTVGHIIGTLFLRSYERGERVHAAMLARGWQHLPNEDLARHASAGTTSSIPHPADLLLTLGLLSCWLWMRFFLVA